MAELDDRSDDDVDTTSSGVCGSTHIFKSTFFLLLLFFFPRVVVVDLSRFLFGFGSRSDSSISKSSSSSCCCCCCCCVFDDVVAASDLRSLFFETLRSFLLFFCGATAADAANIGSGLLLLGIRLPLDSLRDRRNAAVAVVVCLTASSALVSLEFLLETSPFNKVISFNFGRKSEKKERKKDANELH